MQHTVVSDGFWCEILALDSKQIQQGLNNLVQHKKYSGSFHLFGDLSSNGSSVCICHSAQHSKLLWDLLNQRSITRLKHR